MRSSSMKIQPSHNHLHAATLGAAVAIGVAVGVASGNLAVGIAVGVVFMGGSALFNRRNKGD